MAWLRDVNPEKVAKLYREAKELSDAGSVGEAALAYRTLLALDPTFARARKDLGWLHECQGDYEGALIEYEMAERLDPDDIRLQCKVAAVLISLGQYALAEAKLKRLIRMHPYNPGARELLGLVYLQQGLSVHAAEQLQRVTELDGTRSWAYLYLGEALSRLDDIDGAHAALLRFVELGPNKPWIFYRLGNLYDRKQQPQLAKLAYCEAGGGPVSNGDSFPD